MQTSQVLTGSVLDPQLDSSLPDTSAAYSIYCSKLQESKPVRKAVLPGHTRAFWMNGVRN